MEHTSMFLEFIQLQAEDSILEDKGDLYPSLEKAVKEGKDLFKYVEGDRFNPNIHLQCNNRHSAPRSTGCNCAYCRTRHTYAKMKLDLHRKKRSFERFYDIDEEYGKRAYVKFQQEKAELENLISEERKKLYKIKETYKLLGIHSDILL